MYGGGGGSDKGGGVVVWHIMPTRSENAKTIYWSENARDYSCDGVVF